MTEGIARDIAALWPRRNDSTYVRDLIHVRLRELRVLRRTLAFGLEPTQLAEPFCACGHVVSRCDGSRRRCRKP